MPPVFFSDAQRADYVAACRKSVAADRKELSRLQAIEGGERKGFIYLACSPARNVWKIGRSRDLAGRLATFRQIDPSMEIVHWFPAANAPEVEALFIRSIRDHRVNGREWFSFETPDPDDDLTLDITMFLGFGAWLEEDLLINISLLEGNIASNESLIAQFAQ